MTLFDHFHLKGLLWLFLQLAQRLVGQKLNFKRSLSCYCIYTTLNHPAYLNRQIEVSFGSNT